jgi:Putative phage metallopeptidase
MSFAQIQELSRPLPPLSLREPDVAGTFERAAELENWILDAFLDDDSPLYHEEHVHLREARVGVLWSNIPVKRRGTPVAGYASMAKPHPALSLYDRQVYTWFVRSFFGDEPLNFLITLDAPYAHGCSDVNFLALVKHELVHCGQARDEEGELRFTKKEFKPVFALVGHDVEEQIAVVRDFGLVGRNVREFVEAAGRRPRIAQAEIDWACGNCLAMAA